MNHFPMRHPSIILILRCSQINCKTENETHIDAFGLLVSSFYWTTYVLYIYIYIYIYIGAYMCFCIYTVCICYIFVYVSVRECVCP